MSATKAIELEKFLQAESSKESPRFRFRLEPTLNGVPFPVEMGGSHVTVREPNKNPYEGVMYVYDEQALDQLNKMGVLRSLRTNLTEGVDGEGVLCKKVYVHGGILKDFLDLLDDEPRQKLEQDAAIETLKLNVDSRVALSVANIAPYGEAGEGLDHALVMRVLDHTPPKVGYQLLSDAGLIASGGDRDHIPHYVKKDVDDHAYTVVIPVTKAIADAILASPNNHCRNWADKKKAKSLGLNGKESIEDLADIAALEPEMNNGLMPLVAKKDNAERTAQAAQPDPEEIKPQGKSLEKLRDYKDPLLAAGLVQSMQTLANGTRQIMLGTTDRGLIERLSASNRSKPVISDPLEVGFGMAHLVNDKPMQFYVISQSELNRLCATMKVKALPEVADLPTRIPKDPFRRAFAGDYGRTMPIRGVVLHREGDKHVMYAVSDSAARLKIMADNFGFSKASRGWVTSEDETPSIIRIEIPKTTYEAVKKERIRGVEVSHGNAAADSAPEEMDASMSAADVVAKMRATYTIVDKSRPKPAADRSDVPSKKKPKIGPEEGFPLLRDAVLAAKSQEVNNPNFKEGKASNEPPKVSKFLMTLARVRHEKRSEDLQWTTSELYIRGRNDNLRALVRQLKDQGWLDEEQIRYEVGRKADSQLSGLVAITLPDDAWKKLSDDADLRLSNVTPQQLGVVPSEGDPKAFQNGKQAKLELPRYFDSMQRFGKYISPEELALSNLKDKAIRVVTITKPDATALKQIDDQIGRITESLNVLRETAQRLKDHAALVAFRDAESAKGRKQRRGAKATSMDGIGAVIKTAGEGAARAVSGQEQAVRRLQAEVQSLQGRRQSIEQHGMRQEIVVLDPDTQTESLLRDAKEIVVGPVSHEGKALRFAPAPELLDMMRSRNMRTDRLRADPVPEGEVGVAVGRALERHKRKQSDETKRQEGGDAPRAPKVVHKTKRPSRGFTHYSKAVQPILVYERSDVEGGDRSQSRSVPILILPLRDADAGDKASALCRKLSELGWLDAPEWHYLNRTEQAQDEAGTRDAKAPSRRANRPMVEQEDSHYAVQIKNSLQEVLFHLKRIADGSAQSFNHSQFQSLVGDLLSALDIAPDRQSPDYLAMMRDKREIAGLFDQDQLKGELIKFKAMRIEPSEAKVLLGQLTQLERTLKTRHSAMEDDLDVPQGGITKVRGEPEPYPLDAAASSDSYIYAEALSKVATRMQGKADVVPAVKVYLSEEGAESLKDWYRECGVNVDSAQHRLKPEDLPNFAYHKLAELHRDSSHRDVG